MHGVIQFRNCLTHNKVFTHFGIQHTCDFNVNKILTILSF